VGSLDAWRRILRMVGVNARSVWQPAGTMDLATIWLDAKAGCDRRGGRPSVADPQLVGRARFGNGGPQCIQLGSDRIAQQHPEAVLRLTALPDTLERNRLYPVN